MGAVSDRSNARGFMACGLLFTALCNFAFGSVTSYPLPLALWSLNGFFQGMGWPPCGRSMGHWFSKRGRGLAFSIWNTSTNVGGGLAGVTAAWAASSFGAWQYAFYFPGALAAVGSLYLFWRLRDTPQSVGLPPIKEHHPEHDTAPPPNPQAERELTTRELLFQYVLTNKYIWLVAVVPPHTLRADDLPELAGSMDAALEALFTKARTARLLTDFPDVVVKWLGTQEKH